MHVTVNGAVLDLADGATVADVVATRVEDQRRVAVARNGEVVPRSEWATTQLEHGQRVEVLRAAQGG